MSVHVESPEMLLDLFQHVPCGIHFLDAEGVIVEVNDTEAEWLGYRRKELIGKRIFELMTADSQIIFLEKFPQFKVLGFLRDLQIELLRKNGTVLPVSVTATAVRSPEGFQLSRSVLYDMTERKRVEQMQLLLAAIVASSNDGIVTTDLDFTITSWNPAAEKMYGYTAEEMIGQSLAVLVPNHLLHELGEFRSRINGGGSFHQFETVRLRKSGHRIHVSLNVFPIKDGAGKLLGVSIIAHDDTEQRRERLRREQLIHKLQAALKKVKLMSGLLPICASCKKIRDEKGAWHHLEQFIGSHSEAKFTHGICPECRLKLYPDSFDKL